MLLTDAMLGHGLYDSWRRDAFAERHGQVELKVEAYPYAATAAHLEELVLGPKRHVWQLLWVGRLAIHGSGERGIGKRGKKSKIL